jgi:hypothetical protein
MSTTTEVSPATRNPRGKLPASPTRRRAHVLVVLGSRPALIAIVEPRFLLASGGRGGPLRAAVQPLAGEGFPTPATAWLPTRPPRPPSSPLCAPPQTATSPLRFADGESPGAPLAVLTGDVGRDRVTTRRPGRLRTLHHSGALQSASCARAANLRSSPSRATRRSVGPPRSARPPRRRSGRGAGHPRGGNRTPAHPRNDGQLLEQAGLAQLVGEPGAVGSAHPRPAVPIR